MAAAIPAKDYRVADEIAFGDLQNTNGGGQSAYVRSKSASDKYAKLVAVSGLSAPFGVRTPQNESNPDLGSLKGVDALRAIRAFTLRMASGSISKPTDAVPAKKAANVFRCVASTRVSRENNADFAKVIADADAQALAFWEELKKTLPPHKHNRVQTAGLREGDFDAETGKYKYDPLLPLKFDVPVPTNEAVDFIFAGTYDPKTGKLNDRDSAFLNGCEIKPERPPFNTCRVLRRNKDSTIVNRVPVEDPATGTDMVCERTGRVILRYFDLRDLRVDDVRDAINFSAKIEINSFWLNATSYGVTWVAREMVFDESDHEAREETATLVDADGTIQAVSVGFAMPKSVAAAAASSSDVRAPKRGREHEEATAEEPAAKAAVPPMTADEWDEFATQVLEG